MYNNILMKQHLDAFETDRSSTKPSVQLLFQTRQDPLQLQVKKKITKQKETTAGTLRSSSTPGLSWKSRAE
jgi:hypothetical protein